MAICVDRLRSVKPTRGWPWFRACHLFDDHNDLAALHSFAERIGLKPEWFQDRPGFPHYDVTYKRRMVAVALGAKEVRRPKHEI